MKIVVSCITEARGKPDRVIVKYVGEAPESFQAPETHLSRAGDNLIYAQRSLEEDEGEGFSQHVQDAIRESVRAIIAKDHPCVEA